MHETSLKAKKEADMKKQKYSAVPAAVNLILALVAAIGSRTFLGPCVHEDGTFGACHWAGQALFGIALVMAAEGLIAALWKNAAVRAGLYISMLLTAILGILIPGTLISLCGMASMRCRTVMRPSMMILFSLMFVAAGTGALLSREG